MTVLDDLTLMQWFVSGDATLEANQTLRIQPTTNARQLFGRKGRLLATAFDQALPPRIEVRKGTDYTEILHQILVDHHFVPIGQGLDSQVLSYSLYPIPEGYHLVYAEARQLWKAWWTHPSHLNERHLQLDLFVLAEHQWYPIRNIALNSSTLYVETLRGETVHHGDDLMVWLEKEPVEAIEHTQLWAPPPRAGSTQAIPTPLSAQAATAATPAAITAVVDPTLAPVVYALDDKIYVQTSMGVVIIEGQHLKAYSPARPVQAVRQPVP
jgi:hypothetical protein